MSINAKKLLQFDTKITTLAGSSHVTFTNLPKSPSAQASSGQGPKLNTAVTMLATILVA